MSYDVINGMGVRGGVEGRDFAVIWVYRKKNCRKLEIFTLSSLLVLESNIIFEHSIQH